MKGYERLIEKPCKRGVGEEWKVQRKRQYKQHSILPVFG
jgi:hypothetical protein